MLRSPIKRTSCCSSEAEEPDRRNLGQTARQPAQLYHTLNVCKSKWKLCFGQWLGTFRPYSDLPDVFRDIPKPRAKLKCRWVLDS